MVRRKRNHNCPLERNEVMNSRRRFIGQAALGSVAAVIASHVQADAPMVAETDPMALQLGYVSDAPKANRAKFPTYQAGQICAGCQLFQGKPGSSSGPCSLFVGKQVAAGGWCSAFAKRA